MLVFQVPSACVCICVLCVCVCVHAFKIVSMDKILCFIYALIIIIIKTSSQATCQGMLVHSHLSSLCHWHCALTLGLKEWN